MQGWSRFAPSQWETALLCNDVAHWLGANLESVLHMLNYWCKLPVPWSSLKWKYTHNLQYLMQQIMGAELLKQVNSVLKFTEIKMNHNYISYDSF